MRWAAAIAVLAVLALTSGASAQEGRQNPGEVRTTATAHRSVRPDLAIVRLSFSAKAGTPREAGRALAARADSLRRALMAIGIPRDSLITASRWYWWNGRVESVAGTRCLPLPERTPDGRTCMMVADTSYRARDAIEVHIHDMSKIGAVIDSAMAHHLTNISDPQFRATNITAAYEDALREATATARRQAEAIAAASGTRVGRAILLSTNEEPRPWTPTYGGAAVSMSGNVRGDSLGPVTTVVEPSISVTATVSGRWELVDQP